MRERESRKLGAWKIARLLFAAMGRFDRLAVVLDSLDTLIAMIDSDSVQDVMQFYNLSELKAKLRVYAKKCAELADAVDKLLREAGQK
jgi:hypothetical protein